MLAAPSVTLKLPLPSARPSDGLAVHGAGQRVLVVLRCPPLAWYCTPAGRSAKASPEPPSPLNSGTPLLSVRLASENSSSRRLRIWFASVVRSRVAAGIARRRPSSRMLRESSVASPSAPRRWRSAARSSPDALVDRDARHAVALGGGRAGNRVVARAITRSPLLMLLLLLGRSVWRRSSWSIELSYWLAVAMRMSARAAVQPRLRIMRVEGLRDLQDAGRGLVGLLELQQPGLLVRLTPDTAGAVGLDARGDGRSTPRRRRWPTARPPAPSRHGVALAGRGAVEHRGVAHGQQGLGIAAVVFGKVLPPP